MTNTELGAELKRIRKLNKITLNDVEAITGFCPAFMSNLERGKRNATLETLQKVSAAYGRKLKIMFKLCQE